MMKVYRGYFIGPRWIGFPSYIKVLAHISHLDLTLDVDKGWITETVLYTVKGEDYRINWFRKTLEKDLVELGI